MARPILITRNFLWCKWLDPNECKIREISIHLDNLEDQDSRGKAALKLYEAGLTRIQSRKLIEILRAIGAKSFTGLLLEVEGLRAHLYHIIHNLPEGHKTYEGFGWKVLVLESTKDYGVRMVIGVMSDTVIFGYVY